MNRVRAGYCTTPNPFNAQQISRISLWPEDVDVIVFWTRNPKPLAQYLPELLERGYRFYFQYTILGNPPLLDPNCPPTAAALTTFQSFSEQVGPEKMIWRYDPIVLSSKTPVAFHLQTFGKIASALQGYTQRVVISLVDIYKTIASRIRRLEEEGLTLEDMGPDTLTRLISGIAEIAAENGMRIQSCAEDIDLQPYGVSPGKCIDDALIQEVFRINVGTRKDPSQRKLCGCVLSKDIGMYDTCPFNCAYCYATRSFDAVRNHRAEHDPESPSLVGWYEPTAGKRKSADCRKH